MRAGDDPEPARRPRRRTSTTRCRPRHRDRGGLHTALADNYQRWGMEIVAFHRHAVAEARRHLKPSIPERGARGIPIAHELELELRLQPGCSSEAHSETSS